MARAIRWRTKGPDDFLTGAAVVRIYLCTFERGKIVQPETNTTLIKARLEREGWELVGGTRHDKYRKGNDFIMVPRHSRVSPYVARQIAKAAGWGRGR